MGCAQSDSSDASVEEGGDGAGNNKGMDPAAIISHGGGDRGVGSEMPIAEGHDATTDALATTTEETPANANAEKTTTTTTADTDDDEPATIAATELPPGDSAPVVSSATADSIAPVRRKLSVESAYLASIEQSKRASSASKAAGAIAIPVERGKVRKLSAALSSVSTSGGNAQEKEKDEVILKWLDKPTRLVDDAWRDADADYAIASRHEVHKAIHAGRSSSDVVHAVRKASRARRRSDGLEEVIAPESAKAGGGQNEIVLEIKTTEPAADNAVVPAAAASAPGTGDESGGGRDEGGIIAGTTTGCNSTPPDTEKDVPIRKGNVESTAARMRPTSSVFQMLFAKTSEAGTRNDDENSN